MSSPPIHWNVTSPSKTPQTNENVSSILEIFLLSFENFQKNLKSKIVFSNFPNGFSFLPRCKPLLIFHFIVLPCRLLLLRLQIFPETCLASSLALWSAIERSAVNEMITIMKKHLQRLISVYCLVRLIIFHFTLVHRKAVSLDFASFDE
jgi:hypothetical protein